MMSAAESINSIIGEIARLSKGELIVSILVGGVVVLCIYFWFRKQLKKALDEISTKINEVDARFTNVGTEINGVSEKFTNVGDQINDFEEKLGTYVKPISMSSQDGALHANLSSEHNTINAGVKEIIRKQRKDANRIKAISDSGIDAAQMKLSIDLIIAAHGNVLIKNQSLEDKNDKLIEKCETLSREIQQVREALSREIQQVREKNQALVQKIKTLSEERTQLKQLLVKAEKPAPERSINNDEWDMER